jgi:uncharacterized membrane protein YoaK (UPF0700 family)
MLSADAPDSVRAAARTRFAQMMPAIAAFAIGAMAGALGFRYLGFWVLLVPACALVALALTTGEHERAALPGST